MSSVTLPANLLWWNTTYYWHVYTYDGTLQTNPTAVWSFSETNAAPPTPTATSPSVDQVLTTTNLGFAASSVVDPNADAVAYRFQVATGADGLSGRLATSPWGSSPSWTPPPGTFADGGTYYWIVQAQDPYGFASAWSAPARFRIDLRLGARATLPFDDLGPAAVNLSNGNLVLSKGGPSFPTVGGPVGASFVYNSQAPAYRGLSGSYYQDVNNLGAWDPGEPLLAHRLDPQVSFNWGTPGPGPGPDPGVLAPEHYVVVWTGAIRVPAGAGSQWYFASNSDDSMKIEVNGAVVLNGAGALTAASAVTLTSTSWTPIKVTYVQNTGAAFVHLQIRKPTETSPYDIPTDWLSPDTPSLPDGWSRTGDSYAPGAFSALRLLNGSTTVAVDSSGADHLYSFTGSGWQPPAGESSILTQRPDGTWTLLGDDGYLYGFSVSGQLTSVTSAADDLHPGAPVYAYASPNNDGVSRLTSITDATGRAMSFVYGSPAGNPACPAASGFSAAAADMLCRVSYDGFGGGSTDLYYSLDAQGVPSGHLARIVNPGGETTDFGYDATSGMLIAVRDPLANDLIASGIFTDPSADTHKTLISYAGNEVASVKAPVASASMTDAARPAHSYVYTPSTGMPTQTDVHVAGAAEPSGYSRRVVLDATGHASQERDAASIATDNTWDGFNDRITKVVDHHNLADPTGGLVTTYLYDAAGRLTDTYGPGSPGEFGSDNRSATAPHNTTGYDEAISGLATAWWTNRSLVGPAAAHATGGTSLNWGRFSQPRHRDHQRLGAPERRDHRAHHGQLRLLSGHRRRPGSPALHRRRRRHQRPGSLPGIDPRRQPARLLAPGRVVGDHRGGRDHQPLRRDLPGRNDPGDPRRPRRRRQHRGALRRLHRGGVGGQPDRPEPRGRGQRGDDPRGLGLPARPSLHSRPGPHPAGGQGQRLRLRVRPLRLQLRCCRLLRVEPGWLCLRGDHRGHDPAEHMDPCGRCAEERPVLPAVYQRIPGRPSNHFRR